MGLFELYVPDTAGGGSKFKSNLYTMARPRVFMTKKSRHALFQVDYSFGYRRDNHESRIHSSEHSAVANFTYQISHRVSLHVSDDFRSQFNDRSVLPSSSTPVLYQPGFAQGLYLPGERTTSNAVVTGLTYQVGKRSNVTVFNSYELLRYGASKVIGWHGEWSYCQRIGITVAFQPGQYSGNLQLHPGRFYKQGLQGRIPWGERGTPYRYAAPSAVFHTILLRFATWQEFRFR